MYLAELLLEALLLGAGSQRGGHGAWSQPSLGLQSLVPVFPRVAQTSGLTCPRPLRAVRIRVFPPRLGVGCPASPNHSGVSSVQVGPGSRWPLSDVCVCVCVCVCTCGSAWK